jgi:hypothetical protein
MFCILFFMETTADCLPTYSAISSDIPKSYISMSSEAPLISKICYDLISLP